MKLIFLIFLNFLFISIYYCQDYPIDPTGKCGKYPGDTQYTKCSQYLSNMDSLYFSATTNESYAMSNLDTYFKLLTSYGGAACQTSFTYKTLCSMFLPDCETFKNNNTQVSIPKRVCLNTCFDVTNTCGIPAALYDCNQLEPVSNLPLFPKEFTEYNLTSYGGESDYKLQCFNPPKDNRTIIIESCPYPLIYRNRTTTGNIKKGEDIDLGYVYVNNESFCTVQCPPPIFSHDEWDNIFATSDAISMVSLLCAIYLFITYIVINQNRNKYDVFFGFFVFSIILMSVAGTMGFSVGGTRRLICPEENRRAVSSDPSALAAGFIFQFAIINAIAWYTINSFELWFQIKYMKKNLQLMKFYIPGVLIVSLALSTPLIGLKDFKAGVGNFLVWIDTNRYQNFFFFGPLGFVLTIGTVFIGLVIYEIYKIVSSTNKNDFWKLQLKPLMNIFLVYLSFIYLFGYNYFIHDTAENYYNSIQDFYMCILQTDGVDCRIQGPPYSSILMFVFCLRIYGVYAIVLYGYTPKTKAIWKNSFIFNNSMADKLKSLVYSNNSLNNKGGITSSTDIKMTTNGMDSGGGKSSSMEPDDIIIR